MFEPNQKDLLAQVRVYIPVKNSWAVSARLEPSTSLTQFLDFDL